MWLVFGFFVLCGVGFFVVSACYDGLRRWRRRFGVVIRRRSVALVEDGSDEEVKELSDAGMAFCFVEADEADEEYVEVCVNR